MVWLGEQSPVSLHDALKASYAKPEEQREKLIRYGYVRDDTLSNHNQQVYHNPKNNKLLYTIAGTHNLADVGTDAYLALGKLKDTNRYKEADKTLKRAQEKYKGAKTSIAAHSLGGSIAQYLHNRGDTTTLDAGYTIGQKTRGKHYRHEGDIVSLLGKNGKHTTTLGKGKGKAGGVGALYNHKVDRLKDEKIFV